MGRRNIADGLVAQLQQVSGFTVATKGTALLYDHRVLGQGVDRAAIVLADAFEAAPIASGNMQRVDWDIEVGLYIRHSNDVVQARKDADTYLDNVMTRLRQNPTLGGSALDSNVVRGQVQDERFQWGKVPFLLELVTVRCREVQSG